MFRFPFLAMNLRECIATFLTSNPWETKEKWQRDLLVYGLQVLKWSYYEKYEFLRQLLHLSWNSVLASP